MGKLTGLLLGLLARVLLWLWDIADRISSWAFKVSNRIGKDVPKP